VLGLLTELENNAPESIKNAIWYINFFKNLGQGTAPSQTPPQWGEDTLSHTPPPWHLQRLDLAPLPSS